MEKKGVFDISIINLRQLLELDACTRCGECVNLCPTYSVVNDKRVTPREKIQWFKRLIRSQYGLRARIFGPKPIKEEELREMAEKIYMCSTCAQCQVVCPSKIDTVELWERGMRWLLVKEGLGPMKRQERLIESTKKYDNPWRKPPSVRDEWIMKLRKEKGLKVKDFTEEKAEILYFVGCTASLNENLYKIAMDTAEILSKAGVDFGVLGSIEKCCGSVFLRMGDWADFERLARKNIELFNKYGVETIITSCAGCFRTLNRDYQKVERVDNIEIMHTSQLVEKLIKEGRLKLENPINMKVTYHDPCHLGRHMGVYDAPRNILKKIPGVEFVEMERSGENSLCCGAGGGQRAGFPEVVGEIAKKRVKMAEETGAVAILSCCPFCSQTLELGVNLSNSPLKVMDVTEVVNKAATY
ncbi:MAG: (Fe-S)-binding protein [Candidatus Methanospirareceae archaeon]